MNMKAIGFLLASTLLASGADAQTPGRAPISVEDLTRFATIGDPQTLGDDGGAIPAEDVRSFSPDGKHVAAVVRRGNPEKGTLEGSLLVFKTADLMNGPAPVTVAEFASAGQNIQPLAFVRWLSDNETLVFTGTSGTSRPQIYSANIRTGKLTQLSQLTDTLADFDIDATGSTLAVTQTSTPVPVIKNAECVRVGCRVPDHFDLYELGQGVSSGSNPLTIYNLRDGSAKVILSPEISHQSLKMCLDPLVAAPGMSPDQRYVLRLCEHRAQQEPWWTQYSASRRLRDCVRDSNRGCWRRYMLVDLKSGESTALSEAPSVYRQATPVWIHGGRGVVLAGAIEPLVGVDAAERKRRASSLAVLLFDTVTKRMTRIARLDAGVDDVTDTIWDEASQTLTVKTRDLNRKPLADARYRYTGGRWVEAAGLQANARSESTKPSIDLVVEQTLNDRPLLVAIDKQTGQRRVALDPNPWLAQRELGRVESIKWKSKDGSIWGGGLYYPPGFTAGTRYPLMLQTHGFDDGVFSLDGYTRNYAARTLAANGIMVLQIEENFGDDPENNSFGNPKEYDTINAGWEGAIDHLSGLGLIDREKVGIVGWSRTGPQMGFTLTHSDYPFAAAAFTDSADFGWLYYLYLGGVQGAYDVYGVRPFGAEMKTWLERAPTFNLERVRTPVLMYNGGNGTATWDWYVGLRAQNKPVENWVVPTAAHDLMQTPQRLKSNQLYTDWFTFWLKGEERKEPLALNQETTKSLAEQYARWRALRKQQDAVLAQPRPPLLEWTAKPREMVPAPKKPAE